MTAPPKVQAVFDWLVDGAPGARTPMDVLARMLPDLVDAQVPIDRAEAFVRTLHPHIAGRSFAWIPGQPVAVVERTYAFLHSPAFEQSATARVFKTGEPVRAHLERGETLDDPELRALATEGWTDFYAAPLKFVTGQVHAITFATRRAGGFTDNDVKALAYVVRPLSRIGEIFALLRTSANLLNTYVGHDAGERILSGHIRRGDTSILDAVIWFSDLRGFTSLSSSVPPQEIIAILNDLFDCQVPAIEQQGGEVLKFIGDGLLAIFPVAREEDRRARCDAAVAAARAAFTSLDALNLRREDASKPPVRFGLALHVGEIAYGNVGGASRLDFTCIGPAVNLAARLEGLTGKLSRAVVVSEEFSKFTTAALEPLGEFELKGVPGAASAFALRA